MGLLINLVDSDVDGSRPGRVFTRAAEDMISACVENDLSRTAVVLLAQDHLCRHGAVVEEALEFFELSVNQVTQV